MSNIKIIKLHSQEIKKEKQTFVASSAEINGTWYKIKFTKDCENAPKRKGLYKLAVNIDDCSFEPGKPYKTENGKRGVSNPIVWVRKITKIVPYTEEELKEMNREAMNNVFGESTSEFTNEVTEDDDRLPF